jgi:uncharacterized protein CbrC (UPF0167 family)
MTGSICPHCIALRVVNFLWLFSSVWIMGGFQEDTQMSMSCARHGGFFYVGFTRAEEELHIMYTTTKPSPFVSEVRERLDVED